MTWHTHYPDAPGTYDCRIDGRVYRVEIVRNRGLHVVVDDELTMPLPEWRGENSMEWRRVDD